MHETSGIVHLNGKKQGEDINYEESIALIYDSILFFNDVK